MSQKPYPNVSHNGILAETILCAAAVKASHLDDWKPQTGAYNPDGHRLTLVWYRIKRGLQYINVEEDLIECYLRSREDLGDSASASLRSWLWESIMTTSASIPCKIQLWLWPPTLSGSETLTTPGCETT